MRITFCAVAVTVAMLTAGCGAAAADTAAATTCRGNLSEVGKQMYDATAPHVTAGANIANLLRTHVRPLVMGGKIARADAQAAGPAVGACLRLLQV